MPDTVYRVTSPHFCLHLPQYEDHPLVISSDSPDKIRARIGYYPFPVDLRDDTVDNEHGTMKRCPVAIISQKRQS
jgi:hypothetical protein